MSVRSGAFFVDERLGSVMTFNLFVDHSKSPKETLTAIRNIPKNACPIGCVVASSTKRKFSNVGQRVSKTISHLFKPILIKSSPMLSTPLSQATIDQYNQEGWCLLGRVMDDETIEKLRAEEAKFRNRPLHYDDPNPNPPTLFRSQMTAYSAPVRDFGLNGPAHSFGATSPGAEFGLDLYAIRDQISRCRPGKIRIPLAPGQRLRQGSARE
jgi:hypothetical protein